MHSKEIELEITAKDVVLFNKKLIGEVHMFSHVMLGATDIEKSKIFYDATLGVLGQGLEN